MALCIRFTCGRPSTEKKAESSADEETGFIEVVKREGNDEGTQWPLVHGVLDPCLSGFTRGSVAPYEEYHSVEIHDAA